MLYSFLKTSLVCGFWMRQKKQFMI